MYLLDTALACFLNASRSEKGAVRLILRRTSRLAQSHTLMRHEKAESRYATTPARLLCISSDHECKHMSEKPSRLNAELLGTFYNPGVKPLIGQEVAISSQGAGADARFSTRVCISLPSLVSEYSVKRRLCPNPPHTWDIGHTLAARSDNTPPTERTKNR